MKWFILWIIVAVGSGEIRYDFETFYTATECLEAAKKRNGHWLNLEVFCEVTDNHGLFTGPSRHLHHDNEWVEL